MKKERLLKELVLCLNIWEKRGYCEFGGMTKCEDCGVPYVMWKLITGQVLDKDKVNKRLALNDWKRLVNSLNNRQGSRSGQSRR